MTKIILCGCLGHMGKTIVALVAARDNCKIVAGVDMFTAEQSEFPIYHSIAEVTERADVVLDFSHPSLLTPILEFAVGRLPVILCTTGYTPEQTAELQQAATMTPIFYSRNMSLGVNLLLELSKKAAKVLGDQFDIEIIEKHHNQKIDAPSGTALMIADAISSVRDSETELMYDRHSQRKKRDQKEIGIHAIRGGTIVGEHEVLFAGRHETLSITHSAQSKELFAAGAVNAAIFMAGKPTGLYDMSDMI